MNETVRLALTCGDPAGIGPEIIARALDALSPVETEGLVLRLIGDPRVFAAAGVMADDLRRVDPVGAFDAERAPAGRPSRESGLAAGQALLHAIDLAMAGQLDAIVTAPLSKEALRAAGYPWPGHTEALIERSGVDRGVMLFVGGGLKVALATRHMALADVPGSIRKADVILDLRLLAASLEMDFGVVSARIGVTAVNPHAGEGGMFGTEEENLLWPALDELRAEGMDVAGPLPADTAFVRLRAGEFDAVLAMYHDQGLIPFKLLTFGKGVNMTLGLPFIRTSPDHGTAYDVAGKGVASASSILEAIRLGIRTARHRRSFLNRKRQNG